MRALSLALLAGLTGLFGCTDGEATADARPDSAVPVRLVPVSRETVSAPIRTVGVLAPAEQTTLSFKIGGLVGALPVAVGERVRAGQLLATLDPGEIDAQVTGAQVALAQAERSLARVRRLHADSVATLEQLEGAQTGADAARAGLDGARFNRRYAAIHAPTSGVVERTFVERHELVGPGAPVLQLRADGQGWVVRVSLTDRDRVRIRPGDRATVRFDALPDRMFEATVGEITPSATAATGTYPVELTVVGRDPGFGAGLVARIELTPSSDRATRVIVPVAALAEGDGDRAGVFTVTADGVARRVPVKVAFWDGDRLVLVDSAGLPERVVTDGIADVIDGTPVRILR